MMRRSWLATPAVLIAITGCTLIPTYKRPPLPVAAAYPPGAVFASPAPGTLPAAWDIGWKQFFTDPVLQELIGLSLQNNRDLRVDVYNVLSARATYRLDHANLFPTIDGTAEGAFEREPPALSGGFGTLHVNAYSLGLGISSYELDVFGRLRSLARQAREQYLSASETREAMQISLIAQVASQYLAWLADREAIRVARETANVQQRSYDLRVLTLQHGSGTGLDVAQAESSLRTAQASLAQSTRQEAQDMDEIVLLAGTPLPADLYARMLQQTNLNSQPPFPELPAGLPSDLLERRPDIRAAEHTLLAANANIGAARAAFFPSVVLTGSGGTAAGTLGQLFSANTASWVFQPQITIPIFDEGKNFANLDIARVQKRIEIANYEKAIQSAFHDVADALAARTTYSDQLRAEQQLVDADQRYYTLSEMRFEAGVDSSLNVLVAQNSLFSAQLDLVNLRLAERQNLVTLYKDLGGGWN
jgi:multidrug efflux system outer membrane protein